MAILSSTMAATQANENEAKRIFIEVKKWYRANNCVDVYAVAKPKKELVLVNKKMLDSEELDELLSLYSLWMGYYQYFVTFYKGLADHLDNLYNNALHEYFINPPDKMSETMRKSKAKVMYAPLQRAEQIARINYNSYKSKFDLVNTQYALVSRVLTMRGDELRSMK